MNYSQTLEFLFSSLPSFQDVGADAYKPGLERVAEFCRHLGNPQRNYYTIHVAGTNGKGSVSHILASVLREAGYRVGLFTSPHLKDFRERMRVDGEMISKQRVVNFVDKNMSVGQASKDLGISERYLQSVIRDRTGDSFAVYLEKLRVKKAVELLVHTDYSNEQIADEVGFEVLSTFYRAFNRRMGMSPKSFREE